VSNTFLSKVVAERAALAVVNKRYSGNRQLTGLSSASIEQWQSKVRLPANHLVLQLLTKLGEVAQTLSNKSNESFTPLTPGVKATLDQLLQELTAVINSLHSEG